MMSLIFTLLGNDNDAELRAEEKGGEDLYIHFIYCF
jgi:hypothetical protein